MISDGVELMIFVAEITKLQLNFRFGAACVCFAGAAEAEEDQRANVRKDTEELGRRQGVARVGPGGELRQQGQGDDDDVGGERGPAARPRVPVSPGCPQRWRQPFRPCP